MAASFKLEIVTPDKLLFSTDEATYVGFRALSGEIGIEARHMPLISTLDIAPLKVKFADATEKLFAVSGGFLEMKDNKCTVLATIAEAGEEIDRNRAEAAKERAQARLAQKSENLDVQRAELALKRALTRLKVCETIAKR